MEPKPLRIPTDERPTSLLFIQCGHGVLNMELPVISVAWVFSFLPKKADNNENSDLTVF